MDYHELKEIDWIFWNIGQILLGLIDSLLKSGDI